MTGVANLGDGQNVDNSSRVRVRNSGEVSGQSKGDLQPPACTEFSEIREDHARKILEICEKHCFILSTIDACWMMFNKEGDEIKHIKQNKSGFCVENTVEAAQLEVKKTRILLLWLKLRLVFWKKAEVVEIYLNQ